MGGDIMSFYNWQKKVSPRKKRGKPKKSSPKSDKKEASSRELSQKNRNTGFRDGIVPLLDESIQNYARKYKMSEQEVFNAIASWKRKNRR